MATREELKALAKGIVALGVDADLLGLVRVRETLDQAFDEVRRAYMAGHPPGETMDEVEERGGAGSATDAR